MSRGELLRRLSAEGLHWSAVQWIADRLQRFAAPAINQVADYLWWLYGSEKSGGLRRVNVEIARLVAALDAAGARDSSDEARAARADRVARECGRRQPGIGAQEVAWADAREKCEAILLAEGIEPPKERRDMTDRGAVRRMSDADYLLRRMRSAAVRALDAVLRDIGAVRRGRGIYCSDEAVRARRAQRSKNRRILEELVAVNDLGQELGLDELVAASVSNPEIRRGELMARMAGFERSAKQDDHAAVFVTLTCPSRFHRWSGQVQNERWDGSTPRDAQQYLNRVWDFCRSDFQRHNIRPYGFRIAEPHHDGCPHWHLLLFASRADLAEVVRIMTRVGMLESPDEPGASEHRVTAKWIDSARGSAAGYVAKYVAKNIDGFGLQDEEITGVERVDAWAATWRIRQFQQIGGPPVTVWRELRRLRNPVAGLADAVSGVLEAARVAADAGDWAAFVAAMGGAVCARKDRPIAPEYSAVLDLDTGEVTLDRYGDVAAPVVRGVRALSEVVITRVRRWVVCKRGRAAEALAALASSSPLGLVSITGTGGRGG